MKKYLLIVVVTILCPTYPMRYLGINNISDIAQYLTPRSIAALCVKQTSGFITKKFIAHKTLRNFVRSSGVALGQNFFWYPYCNYTYLSSKFTSNFISSFAKSKTKDTNRSPLDAMRVSLATSFLVENVCALGIALYQRDLQKACEKVGCATLATLFFSQKDLQKICGSKMQQGYSLQPPEDLIQFLNKDNKNEKTVTIPHHIFKKIKKSRRQALPFYERLILSSFSKFFRLWKKPSKIVNFNRKEAKYRIKEAAWAEFCLPHMRIMKNFATLQPDEGSIPVCIYGKLIQVPYRYVKPYVSLENNDDYVDYFCDTLFDT